MSGVKRKKISPIGMTSSDNIFDNHWWSHISDGPPIEDFYPQINEPITSVSNDPYIIEVELTQCELGWYIDQSDMRLLIECSIVKNDGGNINHEPSTANPPVVSPYANQGIPECNFIHTIFSDIRLIMNNVLIENANGLWHYKQFLLTMLGCNSVESMNRMALSLYDWNEYGGDFKTIDSNMKRHTQTKNSSVFTMMSQLNLDIQRQPKGFLPHCKLKLQFMLNPNVKYLYFDTGKEAKIKIHKLKVLTKMVQMKDSAAVNVTKRLQHEPISYHVPSIQMSNYNLNKNISEHEFHNVFTHILPNMCLITFVENPSFLGVGNKSVFEFKPFNISHISIHNQNITYPRISGYNFQNNDYKEAYYQLFECLEVEEIHKLSLSNMLEGRMIFAFDLTRSGHFPSNNNQQVIMANTSIKIKWSTAPAENITMIVYSFFEKTVSVDKFGQTIVLET
jgi:hypothetical protein